MKWDVFICHASEDKAEVADPLAAALQERGLRVWYDKYIMTIGDSLREKIDQGLGDTRYGIVIFSPAFFDKQWPKKELDGLVEREIDGRKVILPVWHNVRRSDVMKYSPSLAGRLAGTTQHGIKHLADELLRAISGDPEIPAQAVARSSVDVDITYDRLSIESDLHRYSLVFQVGLAEPPAKDGFRLKLLWPKRIPVGMSSRPLELAGTEKHRQQVCQVYTYDYAETLYPGEKVEVISPRVDAKLVYHYNDDAWDLTEGGNVFMLWELFFKDQKPISGEMDFKQLNIY